MVVAGRSDGRATAVFARRTPGVRTFSPARPGAIRAGWHDRGMSSTTHLLHGLWLPGTGLNLWLERVDGHRVLGALDDGARAALPAAAVGALSSVPRGRPEVELRTPKGKTVRHVLPTWTFVPERAVTVLESLRGDVGDAAFAPDLRFLIRLQEALERWARAGRALVAVTWEDRKSVV